MVHYGCYGCYGKVPIYMKRADILEFARKTAFVGKEWILGC